MIQDVNHINFFDIEYPEIPNDDERVENNLNRDKKSQSDSSSSSVSGSNHDNADFPVDNPGNDADSSGEFVPTQNEGVTTLEENVFFEGNLDQNPSSSHGVQNVRRCSRQSVFQRIIMILLLNQKSNMVLRNMLVIQNLMIRIV
ncbi:hypothetical protein Tco_0598387 [Tanacetum coccineum]